MRKGYWSKLREFVRQEQDCAISRRDEQHISLDADLCDYAGLLQECPDFWKSIDGDPLMVATIFGNAPLELIDQLWNRLYRSCDSRYWVHANPHLAPTLTPWRPSLLENIESRSYGRLFPVLMEMTYFDVVAYKRAHAQLLSDRQWYAMPSLEFLPTAVTKVVAGEGGLLVCDGGDQPRAPIRGERPVPMAENWNPSLYPRHQSIMVVCNPLTREFIYLPPFQQRKLQDKVAAIVFDGPSASNLAAGAGGQRGAQLGRHYKIVAVGYHEEVSTNNANIESLVCAVYSSRKTGYWNIVGAVPGKSRFPDARNGRTGVAVLDPTAESATERENDDVLVCFGGNVVHADRRESPALFVLGLGARRPLALVLPFCPLAEGDEGALHAPIVVQPLLMLGCQSMFAVARRAAECCDTVYVFEVGDDAADPYGPRRPNGTYRLATQMPAPVFQEAFRTDGYSVAAYECVAGNGLICVRVKESPVLALYDLFSGQWFLENYGPFLPTKPAGSPCDQLFEGIWRPCFFQSVLID